MANRTSASGGRYLAARLALVATLALGRAAVAQPISDCTGDIDGDGKVSIGELITGVNIALDPSLLSTGPSFDSDGDGKVMVAELIQAVNFALASSCALAVDHVDDLETVETSSRVAVSAIGEVEVLGFGVVSAPGPARRHAMAGAALTLGSQTCSPGGGKRVVSCRREGGNSVLEQTLTDCREVENGASVNQNGHRTLTVAEPDLCTSNPINIDPALPTTEQLTDFRLEYMCSNGCTAGLTNVTLRAVDLRIERRPNESGHTTLLNGDLRLDNHATGERFAKTFMEFAVTASAGASGGNFFALNGSLMVDCLDELAFNTQAPIRLDAGEECPNDGTFQVTRKPGPLPQSAALSAATLRRGSPENAAPGPLAHQAAGTGAARYREFAFRAANGQVYQVLQNAQVDANSGDAVIGARDVQITTAVGSTARLLGCFQDPGDQTGAQALVATDTGAAFPLAKVTKSDVIQDASEPRFNANAANGAGAVCIGPDCTPDSVCPPDANCVRFSMADGRPLETNGAHLVDPLPSLAGACMGLSGDATYAFGTSSPTIERAQCADSPRDGLTLAGGPSSLSGDAGSTLVLAYGTSLLAPFDVGSAGFALDPDGGAPAGCRGRNVVLDQINRSHHLPPNFVQYTSSRAVQFDTNGDKIVDKTAATCAAPTTLAPRCAAAPTPSPSPVRRELCQPENFAGPTPGMTTGRPNSSGEATCGGGGNEAPDAAFRYTAPQAGVYTIRTTDSNFDTVLYVRDTNCSGAELACNDDRAPDTRESEVAVRLADKQTVIIVVDGFRQQSGTFTLSISVSQNEPTPTPTTPAPNQPDLAVVAVSASPSGMAGGTINVSADVANQGMAEAGSFEVAFVFSTDKVLDANDTSSGFGCVSSQLAPGASISCSGPIPVPESLPTGQYFILATADLPGAVAESDETNNVGATDTAVAITGLSASPSASATPSTSPIRTVTSTATDTVTNTPVPPSPLSTSTATRSATPVFTVTPSPTFTSTRASTPGILPARICTSTVLHKDDSPYVAAQSVIVGGPRCAGTSPTLTIDHGVEIRFKAGGLIIAAGTLLANGIEEDPILFTSGLADKAPGDWGGVEFLADAVGAIFDDQDGYQSGSILQHVIVEYAKDSAGGIITTLDSLPYLSSVRVRNGVATTGVSPGPGSAAIYATGTGTLRMNDINIEPFQYGNGIALNGVSSKMEALHIISGQASTGISLNAGTHTIMGAQILVGGYGLNAASADVTLTSSDVGGGSGYYDLYLTSSTVVVNKCKISGGSSGILSQGGTCIVSDSSISGSTSSAVANYSSAITIRRSIVSGNAGDGLTGSSGIDWLIEDSAIVDNVGNGINLCANTVTLRGDCVAGNGLGGALLCGGSVSQSTFIADALTCPVGTTVTQNNLIPDGQTVFVTTSPTSAGSHSIPGNFWGTTDEDTIASAIHDCGVDSGLACVFPDPSGPSDLLQSAAPGAPDIDACRNRTFDPRMP